MSIVFPYAARRLEPPAGNTPITDPIDPRISVELRNWQIKEFLGDSTSTRALFTRVAKLRVVSRRWRHAVEDYFVSAAPLHQRMWIGDHYYQRMIDRPPLRSLLTKAHFLAQVAQRFGYLSLDLVVERCDRMALLEVPGWSLARYGTINPVSLEDLPLPSLLPSEPVPGNPPATGANSIELVHHHDQNREISLDTLVSCPALLNDLLAFLKRASVRLDITVYLAETVGDLTSDLEQHPWVDALNKLAQAIASDWSWGGRIQMADSMCLPLNKIFVNMLQERGARARLETQGKHSLFHVEFASTKAMAHRSIQFKVEPKHWPSTFFNHELVRDVLGADWCQKQPGFRVRCFEAKVGSGQSKDLLHFLRKTMDLETLELDLSAVTTEPGFNASLLETLMNKRLTQLSLKGMQLDEKDCDRFVQLLNAFKAVPGESRLRLGKLDLRGSGASNGLSLAKAMGELQLKSLKIDSDRWSFNFLAALAAKLGSNLKLERLSLGKIGPKRFMLFASAIAGFNLRDTKVCVLCRLTGAGYPGGLRFTVPRSGDREEMLIGLAWLYRLSPEELRTFFKQAENQDSVPVLGTGVPGKIPAGLSLLLDSLPQQFPSKASYLPLEIDLPEVEAPMDSILEQLIEELGNSADDGEASEASDAEQETSSRSASSDGE